MLYNQIDHEVSKLIFPDLDFSKFIPLMKQIPVNNDEDVEDGEFREEIILWDNDD